MALDIVLIVTASIFAALVLIASFYFVIYFQHPQDKWAAWFPKIVVVLGLSLAAWNLFLLPLGVANAKGSYFSGGLPLKTLTLALFVASILMIIVVVPFTMFYYEGEEEQDDTDVSNSQMSQCGHALQYTIPTLLFVGVLIVGLYYAGLGYAEVPTSYLQSPLFETTGLEDDSLDPFYTFDFYCNSKVLNTAITLNPKTGNNGTPTYIPNVIPFTNVGNFGCKDLPVANGYTPLCCKVTVTHNVLASPIVFIVAIMTLIGWIIFAVFAGVGMSSLPYDWLLDFKHRARPITAAEYRDRKKAIGEKSAALMEDYKQLQVDLKSAARGKNFAKRLRKVKKRENQFRQNVVILEKHYLLLEESYKFNGGDLIVQWAKFLFACLSVLLTLLWVFHIILYVIPLSLQMKGLPINPLNPVMNGILSATQDIPLVGIVLYGVFVFYLMACTMKGNAKLGVRLVFMTVHPLKIGDTLMSSMIFNAGVILICSLPLVQFSTVAFTEYARFTPNQTLFGVQITSLRGLNYGFDVFTYILIGFCFLTFFYQMYRPYSKQKENRLQFDLEKGSK